MPPLTDGQWRAVDFSPEGPTRAESTARLTDLMGRALKHASMLAKPKHGTDPDTGEE
jgi:hypothetical protein